MKLIKYFFKIIYVSLNSICKHKWVYYSSQYLFEDNTSYNSLPIKNTHRSCEKCGRKQANINPKYNRKWREQSFDIPNNGNNIIYHIKTYKMDIKKINRDDTINDILS